MHSNKARGKQKVWHYKGISLFKWNISEMFEVCRIFTDLKIRIKQWSVKRQKRTKKEKKCFPIHLSAIHFNFNINRIHILEFPKDKFHIFIYVKIEAQRRQVTCPNLLNQLVAGLRTQEQENYVSSGSPQYQVARKVVMHIPTCNKINIR